jgi:hypothetical protein
LEVVMDISSRRTTGITGIVFVALAIAIVILGGDADFSRDDAALRDFFVNDTRQAQAVTAVVLLPLAAAALLWFVAGIRTLLRAGDAGGGMLPSAAALGGSRTVAAADRTRCTSPSDPPKPKTARCPDTGKATWSSART